MLLSGIAPVTRLLGAKLCVLAVGWAEIHPYPEWEQLPLLLLYDVCCLFPGVSFVPIPEAKGLSSLSPGLWA